MGAANVDFPGPLLAAAQHVDLGGFYEQVPGFVQPPDAAGGERVHAGGQAGAVLRPGLVIRPVGFRLPVGEALRQKGHERDHVRLLDDLGGARYAVVAAPVFLGMHQAAAHGIQGAVLQAEIPVELRDHAVSFLWRADAVPQYRKQRPILFIIQFLQKRREPRGPVGKNFFQQQGAFQAMPDHLIGEKVVGDALMILVRADHVRKVDPITVHMPVGTGKIEPGAF